MTMDTRCHLHVSTANHSGLKRASTNDENNDCFPDDTEIVPVNKRVPNGTRVLVENQIGQILGNEISYHYSVDFGDDTFSNDM